MNSISLALTHYNRFQLLCESIALVQDDPRIHEIVIVDDASTDGSWGHIIERFGGEPKFKLFQNERNLDCYANKRAAVERCADGWVCLFDSDNVLTAAYLDALWAHAAWKTNYAYLPVYAEPHFDYRRFAGMTVTKDTVAGLMHIKNFSTALNTANYVFLREEYLRVWDGKVNPHTADSIYQNLNWLKAGNSLVFVPGMHYFHRVHEASHYKQNHKKTGGFAKQVEQELLQLR